MSHGQRAGRATRTKAPLITAWRPSTATGIANRPAGPGLLTRGGASRWSCQAIVLPWLTRTQPWRSAATRPSAAAVGEPALTHTPVESIRSSGSRSRPLTRRSTPGSTWPRASGRRRAPERGARGSNGSTDRAGGRSRARSSPSGHARAPARAGAARSRARRTGRTRRAGFGARGLQRQRPAQDLTTGSFRWRRRLVVRPPVPRAPGSSSAGWSGHGPR